MSTGYKPLNGWVIIKAPTDNLYQGKMQLVLHSSNGIRSLRGTVVELSDDITEVAAGDEVWYQVGSGHASQTAPLGPDEDLVVVPINRDVSAVEILNHLQKRKDAGQDVSVAEQALLNVSQHRGGVIWNTKRRGCGIFAKAVGDDVVPIDGHTTLRLPEVDKSLSAWRKQDGHPTVVASTDPDIQQHVGQQVVIVPNAGVGVGFDWSQVIVVRNEEILALVDQ